MAPAARGRAGLIINFKERKYLKEKPKPDGKGAGQDFTSPDLLMEAVPEFPKAKPLEL